MKRIVLVAVLCIIFSSVFSQTYKLETVYTGFFTETYLSYWKVIDSNEQTDTFSLWGYQHYIDDFEKGVYEVEYYKGNAKETYLFLNQILDFTNKYEEADKVFTYISGIQVKTRHEIGFKFTSVYDKECKVSCSFTLKQWNEILSTFISYCENNDINYK